MKHRAFTLIEGIVVALIIAVLAGILFPAIHHGHSRGSARLASCRSNLKQIGLGFLQYTQDYDEKFPLVANARAGYWAGSLQPYVKSWQIFQCPTDQTSAPKTTDYYYNVRLAQMAADKLKAPIATITVGEGTGDQLPLYNLKQLPAAWRADETSPAWRHLDNANYLFADGHVKSFKSAQITLGKPALKPTFLLK